MKDGHGVWRRLAGGGIYRTLGPQAEGTNPFDQERGDEETLPLIEVDIDNKDQGIKVLQL